MINHLLIECRKEFAQIFVFSSNRSVAHSEKVSLTLSFFETTFSETIAKNIATGGKVSDFDKIKYFRQGIFILRCVFPWLSERSGREPVYCEAVNIYILVEYN